MRNKSGRALRRALFGFKQADVLELLERRSEELARMAESLDRVWRERDAARRQMSATEGASTLRVQADADERAAATAEARAEAARIVSEAEDEALRIRQSIGSRVAEATARLEELLDVREKVLAELRTLVTEHEQMLARLERGVQAYVSTPAPTPQPVLRAEQPAQLFPRRVDVHAGPFDDFAELSTFERSLARLPAVEDVYIRSFAAHRAQIELTLAHERPLLRDLVAHVPYEIDVAAAGESTVSVDVRGALAG